MRGILAAIAMLTAGLAGEARAEMPPVVVELYTSQGCSSCPPADALLRELSPRDDVIPLALHVDYWDYIGWKDSFADPAHTERQKAYSRAAGHGTIYTPQMIVGGRDHVVGYKPMRLAELIEAHHAQAPAIELTLVRADGVLRIAARMLAAPSGDMVVQLVRYTPEETVEIRRGENAGRSLTYANIVTAWQVLGEWDGAEPLSIDTELSGAAPVVVLIQQAGHGPVLAAARLR